LPDYKHLIAAHERAWEETWQASDVLIEGDPVAQVAIRHSLFQILIAAPRRDDRVSIPAKTLSGFGYRGHVFWDTEVFCLPFFAYTQPHLARNLLNYRYYTLPESLLPGVHPGRHAGEPAAWRHGTASRSQGSRDQGSDRIGEQERTDRRRQAGHRGRNRRDLGWPQRGTAKARARPLLARHITARPASSQCIVIEDAASGIEAALASGSCAVDLGPTERVGAAHVVLPSLENLRWKDLLSLLGQAASAGAREQAER
jgi:hypothetical protein